jgi:predicted Fe-S protein YdhL (DUF1289 family)
MARHPNSPCQQACALDIDAGFCRGCLRRPREIYGWGMLSAAEQWTAVRRLQRHQAKVRKRKRARLAALGY